MSRPSRTDGRGSQATDGDLYQILNIKAQAHGQSFAVLAFAQCSANGFGGGIAGQPWRNMRAKVSVYEGECQGCEGECDS